MNVLECVGLTKRFGAVVAVDSVDLTVAPNTIHAVIGPNGAGKTTLFNLIAGSVKPTRGTVMLDGQNITRLPPQRVARCGVARTFQITALFLQLSARENIRVSAQALRRDRLNPIFGGRCIAATNEIAHTWLDRLGLMSHADKLAGELSHGDQRLVEVAMALAQSPRLLIIDEPTQGMSIDETQKTIAVLKDVLRQRSMSVLLIEHDMEVVFSLADQIAVMHRGRMLADGSPAEVRSNPDVQSAYLGAID